MYKYNLYLISVILLWGCHGKSASSQNSATQSTVDTIQHKQAANVKPLDKGIVIDTVICTDNPGQKYAIYLPSNYSSAKKWPIIYFFDPHGAGNLPLNLYKSLAEKYGFIIAGTYGSKNGMQWEESDKAAHAFMQDTWQRLSIDNNRIYTYGFSGGARVACSVALTDGGVAGVAACGGGFPQRHPQITQQFSCISFVGERDFNYIELKQLDKELDDSPLTHQLIIFHGKHQWPPLVSAEEAFQWFDLEAMRLKTLPKNDSLIYAVQKELVKEVDGWREKKNEVKQYFALKKMLNFLRGLTETGKYSAELQTLQNSATVITYLKNEQTDEMQEAKVQQDFIQDLSSKDEAWWRNTVKQMHVVISADSTSPVALQTQRMLSFLSLATYMGASQAFRSQDDGSASKFLNLYELVDPTNPEHNYLFACMYAREQNNAKAMNNLQGAVNLGFSDAGRMENDSNFVVLKKQPEFVELVKKIKAMPKKIDLTQ